MTLVSETEFENALIGVLRDKGWGEHEVIKNPTEEVLLQNWANILFDNNKGKDRLNNVPLTSGATDHRANKHFKNSSKTQ